MSDTRKPVYWANYRGVIRVADFPRGQVGPNLNGELLYPVEAIFDTETGKTRVGFSLIAPRPTEPVQS